MKPIAEQGAKGGGNGAMAGRQGGAAKLDVEAIRRQFPILQTRVHGKRLVYLDNGATTQKPTAVIDTISRYYREQNANIHRGVYQLSQLATDLYEQARAKVAKFIHAGDPRCCLFTRGTTEGINLVAACRGRTFLKPGDEVIVSAMEHHSNIVPWQIACEMTGAKLRVIPMNDAGELQMDAYEKLLSGQTKFVSVTHLSNSLGTVNDVETIIRLAHGVGAKVMLDGAQWVAHAPTDVQALDVDFYAFSGHKLFGPTGIGILYGKRELLEAMPPYQGGGDMIESVTFEKTTYAALPNKFEAGTPDISGAIGLGAAVDFVNSVGFDAIVPYEADLLAYATEKLQQVPGLRIVGTAERKGGVISFVMDEPAIASLDIGMQLDAEGIAVRTGHHCCQPVMDRMKIAATTRLSLAMYNTRGEIDLMVGVMKGIVEREKAKRASAKPQAPEQELRYPEPAESPDVAAEELVGDFDLLGEWEGRHQYVVELGEKLPFMPAEMKTETNRVHGCQSTVHLAARKKPGTTDVMEFLADSDAALVRGLIAILERVYSGQRASDILAFDMEGFLRRLGLDQQLSMGRRNGLAGMIQRIRSLAAVMVGRTPTAAK